MLAMTNMMEIRTFRGPHTDAGSLDPKSASLTLAKLQNDTMGDFEGITKELKEVYKGQSSYSKALERVRSLFGPFWLQKSDMLFAEVQRQTTADFRLRCAVFPSHVD